MNNDTQCRMFESQMHCQQNSNQRSRYIPTLFIENLITFYFGISYCGYKYKFQDNNNTALQI